MNKRSLFRIIGALGGALMITSLFIPFVNVSSYTQSIWEANTSTQYISYMIIAFSVVAILAFAIGTNTETAFLTVGAGIYYLVETTLEVVTPSNFNTLSVGFYSLLIGVLLILIMILLTNKKEHVKTYESEIKEDKTLENIDLLSNLSNDLDKTQIVEPIHSTEQPMNITEVKPNPVVEDFKTTETNNVEETPVQIQNMNNQGGVNPVLQQFDTTGFVNNSNVVENVEPINQETKDGLDIFKQ